jgi:hypothetical protein
MLSCFQTMKETVRSWGKNSIGGLSLLSRIAKMVYSSDTSLFSNNFVDLIWDNTHNNQNVSI